MVRYIFFLVLKNVNAFFLDKNNSFILFFFGPLLIITVLNSIFFILTALKIHRTQKEIARITAKRESQRSLNKQKDRFVKLL